jgi:hemerythrin superfamily protein
MPDALSLLTADHKRVKRLLKQMEEAEEAGERTEVFLKIAAEVTLHARIEEGIFYPAYHAAAMNDEEETLFFEAEEERRLVLEVLARAQRVNGDSPEFLGVAKVLKHLIEHHAEEEEAEMFPRAKKLMSPEQLAALGARMEATKTAGWSKRLAPARIGSTRLS